ncbi:acyl-CoA binding protein [Trypanosoma cruzi Dm28c]|uniref:Acyl-CoA binding protein n=2 Tax=Trypanosoma cruzi TaxID=5693 RepID=V5DM18_TRYCR|nr:acyl-CoA binding protein [Trypanosoma cruzi Dm28c]KAF8276674.1 acyl-CoA binding protein [Trypanosoma cruzi]PBJ68987.1 acyl-CoA binding protein [Trypanosoma cruzi cruzi]PWV00236.1 putative acyl-CoA binding protein [Trypanosoma cruzi]
MPRESLEERFQRLAGIVGKKATRPHMSLSKKLELYGLWNQVMHGPNKRPQPSRMNPVAYAKWKAYKNYEHLSKEEAMKKFNEIAEKAIAFSKL